MLGLIYDHEFHKQIDLLSFFFPFNSFKSAFFNLLGIEI